MDILVCVKRVPATGGYISLTADNQQIDTTYASFTVSPHEECAVEEAIRKVEVHGGSTAVLTLGPEESVDQLRDAMAMGIQRAIHLRTEGEEWDPGATAGAIAETIGTQQVSGHGFDLVLFGNEAADTGDYQVGIRVAHSLGWPCVTGAKSIDIENEAITVRREAYGGWEILQVNSPAVITVKEGINLPRYPTVPGRLKAKRAPIETIEPQSQGNALQKLRLQLPPDKGQKGEIIGQGPAAAPRLVEIFRQRGIIAP